MKFFLQLNLLLDWNVLFALAGWRDIPRRILKDRSSLTYATYQNHTVFFHPEDSDELYVGGTGFVLQVDVANNRIIEEFPLNATGEQTCAEGPCENVITVLQKYQDSLMVCASNGQKPRCWKLYSQVDNGTRGIAESFDGTGISPYSYTQNSLSLTVEGDLYTAVSLDHNEKSLQFRRKSGGRPSVWMYGTWLSEPTFISASWVKRTDDPQNEKIYIFFREKNSDRSPEADRWISRVARVCKVDEGGSKRFFQNIWTSFLKARLVCGIPKESLYFNRLQEVYVVHAEDWRRSRVYGLFTSSWNSTAVCIYSMEEIDTIFENSTFKGFDKEIPNPRPGQCVPDSKRLPLATVNVIKDHPEMSDWIHSLHHHAPFYISSHNYTKIAVDQVQAADGHMHNVLLLATDSGTIHKVLEDGSEPFIISETQLFNHSAVIRAMTLESRKKRLVVGFSEQISILDLQRCQDYNASCAECVLARDPYCAWSRSGCSPTAPGSIQNIPRGQINVCHESTEVSPDPNESPQRARRETVSPSPSPAPPPTVRAVPLDVPLYLSCPIDSYHAVYTWEHGGQSSPCLHMQSACLHLIPAVGQGSYGGYACVSTEKDYTRTVTAYQLQPEPDRMCRSTPDGSSSVPDGSSSVPDGSSSVPDGSSSIPDGRSGVSAVIAHGEWLVGLAAVAVVSLLL